MVPRLELPVRQRGVRQPTPLALAPHRTSGCGLAWRQRLPLHRGGPLVAKRLLSLWIARGLGAVPLGFDPAGRRHPRVGWRVGRRRRARTAACEAPSAQPRRRRHILRAGDLARPAAFERTVAPRPHLHHSLAAQHGAAIPDVDVPMRRPLAVDDISDLKAQAAFFSRGLVRPGSRLVEGSPLLCGLLRQHPPPPSRSPSAS
mmetsp:Transcript_25041/g.80328  ORF Transcript_25041/g.80328 Transcript_25041/m.80328 type:complete len:202 (+) Transcript_25041:575-1180(+)